MTYDCIYKKQSYEKRKDYTQYHDFYFLFKWELT